MDLEGITIDIVVIPSSKVQIKPAGYIQAYNCI